MDSSNPTFSLTYQLRTHAHADPLSHEEAEALADDGKIDGACDALLFMTLSFPPDGGVKGHGLGVDGRTVDGAGLPVPLSTEDKFRAWALLTAELSESNLDRDQENVIRDALNGIMAMIAAREARSDGQPSN